MNTISKAFTLGLILASSSALLRADADVDRKIEETARNSYNFHAVLQDKVKVGVSDGVASLTGSLPGNDEKKLAEDTVKAIPGVARVDDQITLQQESSDDRLAAKVRTALLLHPDVSAADTQVKVANNGDVTLTGTADSFAQKDLAESYADDLPGVKSVDNFIVTKWPEQPDKDTTGPIDDPSITAQADYILRTTHATSDVRAQVETHGGVVEVSGKAPDAAAKDLVTQLIQHVRGVKSVDNRMAVGSRSRHQNVSRVEPSPGANSGA